MHYAIMFAVQWLLREIVLKFVLLTSVLVLVAFLVPKVVSFVSPWIGVSSLSSVFTGLPSGVWFFLDFFRLDYGLPLIIAAFATRFLIRRLPVVG